MQERKGGEMKEETAREWKEVEKLAVEVALHPEAFVGGDDELADRLAHATKHLFDLGRRWEGKATRTHGSTLNELALEGFDSEQVWEQLSLHHTPLLRHLRRQAYNLVKSSDKRPRSFFPSIKPEAEQRPKQLEQEEEEEEEEEAVNEEEEEGEEENVEDDESLENGGNGSMEAGESDEEEAMEEADATEESAGDLAEEDEDEEDEDEEDDEVEGDEEGQGGEAGKRRKSTGDRFFNYDDMERFIDEAEIEAENARDEEEKGEKGDEDDEEGLMNDMDEDQEDEEGELDMEMGGLGRAGDGEEDEALGGGIKYDHFFDAPEEEEGGNSKSKKKKKGLEDKIAELENKIVGAKPWQLRGEINNRKRPLNSLLEEHVEFETVIKQAPVITEEVTMALEDIIKRRIVEGSFDDVVRKEEEEVERTHKAAPELDFQKSQKSLAELYEEEYLKNVEKASAKPLGAVEEKKSKDQEEVLRRFAHLSYKLDALCNFHYTPKPVIPDITVKENVAAIRMEEIIPIGVSDASLLAPQEVFKPDRKASALPTADSASAKKRHRKRKQHTGSKALLLLPWLWFYFVGDGMPKGKNIRRAEKSVDGAMTSTKLFKQLTHEQQTAKAGKPTKARAQATTPKGGRKDTGLKL